MRRRYAALLLVASLAGGCGSAPKPASSLTIYTGHGISVGYPKAWPRTQGTPLVMPSAVMEATSPTSTAEARTTGALDVLADAKRPNVPFDEAVSFFVQGSRVQDGFKLLSQGHLRISGGSGTEVEQEYTRGALRIHQVDWLVEPGDGPMVYVRMQFLADHYDARLVRDVGASIRIRNATA